MCQQRSWRWTRATTGLALGMTLTVGGAFAADPPVRREVQRPVQARAQVQTCVDGVEVSGVALLREEPSEEGVKQVKVTLLVSGLPDGKHAVHIHERGLCEAATRCQSAGGHFDPGPNGNSMVDANHPFHTGDLENIEFKNGVGVLQTNSSRVTLSPGPISVFDADGAVIMIHDLADTYCPNGNEAACAGGTRAACGVLQLVK
jgi:superoxide dismutase, Cu-Zn family